MILITCPIDPILTDTLLSKGIAYRHEPSLKYDDLYEVIQEAEGLVISTSIAIDKNILDKATKLKWIGRLGSGMEHVDVTYANTKGIRCESSPEGNCGAVGDHTIGLLIALIRNICKSNTEVKQGRWERKVNTGIELSGKKIGIIGYGHTGTAFARRLRGFDVEVYAHDKYKKEFSDEFVKESSLEEIQSNCDIISFHLPHTRETVHYANKDFFKKIKHGTIIINTSRGSIIDSLALLYALENGKVNTAALDVLENEDASTFMLPENTIIRQLINHPKILVTPHIAGYTQEAQYKMAQVLLEKLGIK